MRGRGKFFLSSEVMIGQRPAEIANRNVPRNLEGDLILGLNNSAIGSLVKHATLFTFLLPLPRMAGHSQHVPVKNGPTG